MDYLTAMYVFLLAGIIGFVFVSTLPRLLQFPLLFASELMNSLLLIGAIIALSGAQSVTHTVIGCIAVALSAANVVGSYLLTQKSIETFSERSKGQDLGGH